MKSEALKKSYSAFTLIEVLTVFAVLAVLLSLLLPVIGNVRERARTSESVSNLRQIHNALTLYANENHGHYPVNYYPSTPEERVDTSRIWYQVAVKYLYPERFEAMKKAGEVWVNSYQGGYEGTVLHSPNRESDATGRVTSYGYNTAFQESQFTKYGLKYDAAKTAMLADNSGKTHELTLGSSAGQINARNAASSDYANDGQAAVIYLDGHTELLHAELVEIINNDPSHTFWGAN